MTEEDVTRLIDEAEDFPKLSSVATDIARMTSDLSAPVKDVALKIQSDASMQNRMLKIINAPFYKLAGGVPDVTTAISLVGYKKICNLAVGISVVDLFPGGSEGGFNYARFWERSICAGAAAGEVAARIPKDLPADLFSAGLMQDIGALFLVRCRPLEYGAAMGVSKAQGVHVAKAERKVLGVDHALVGAALGKKWQLPSLLTEVIRYHHFSEFEESVPDGTRTVIQVANLSNLIADVFFESDGDERREVLERRGRAFFGFGPKMIADLLEKIPESAKEIGAAFSMQVDPGAAPAAEKPKEVRHDTCPECGAADQEGKFCGECGASMVMEAEKPVRDSNKVLIAEDSIASRRALSFVVKKLGYIPVEATNGFEAVELAKRDPPGMIMLDVMMPRMNGLEALKKIRDHRPTASVPVVMLTSLTDSETVVEAVQAGANDYVVKPYTADIIAQRLKKYMPEQKK